MPPRKVFQGRCVEPGVSFHGKNKCLGKPFEVGDSLRKDTSDIDEICLPVCQLGVIKVTRTTPRWRLWSLLCMQNNSTTEKMTFSLLIYNPAITILSDNIFIDLTHLNTLFARNDASKKKIFINDSANVLLLWP